MIQQFLTRHTASLSQLAKFCVVGSSGVLVNLFTAYCVKKVAPLVISGAEVENVWITIPGTSFALRWFMVFSMIAFVVANVWNYQFNRLWSFRSNSHASWWKEFLPFFTVGLIAQGLGMILELALMHPGSPIGLSEAIFDNTTGFRTKWYWAHMIMVCVTVPVSFLLNKFWTFRAIRTPDVDVDPTKEG
ncbi:MAG: GtrA family protein [Propionibacteriaceae bacterium]|nr:GtrA family protein [Propionibacteriaceae bacterium]